jgi:hypothetical protein
MMSVHPIFILVSIWSGVIIFFSAVVAPTVFKSLEEREAGVFLRAFFPKYYIFGIVLGIVSVVTLMFMPINAILTYAIVAMTALTLLGRMSIPIINNARDSGDEAGFKKYHLISVMMNVITLVIGIVILGIYL